MVGCYKSTGQANRLLRLTKERGYRTAAASFNFPLFCSAFEEISLLSQAQSPISDLLKAKIAALEKNTSTTHLKKNLSAASRSYIARKTSFTFMVGNLENDTIISRNCDTHHLVRKVSYLNREMTALSAHKTDPN